MHSNLFERFKIITPINKGWSKDQKYCALAEDGKRMLLRVSDISEYEKKKKEFDAMKMIAKSGINMTQPLDFGTCADGKSVYQLLSWCDAEEAKETLYTLTESEQYAYGRKAAEILRKMEQVNRKPASTDWEHYFSQRLDRYIELYRKCGVVFPGDDVILHYLKTKITCIGIRPTALMHEDFQTDNMIISPDGELYIIDFQMCGQTDPYLVMTGAGVSAEFSPAFARGQMDGYFGERVPDDFWEKYNYYMVAEMLYAFTVAVTMDEEKDKAIYMFDDEIERIRHSGSVIPAWYQ